jgi:hypothetical protein
LQSTAAVYDLRAVHHYAYPGDKPLAVITHLDSIIALELFIILRELVAIHRILLYFEQIAEFAIFGL